MYFTHRYWDRVLRSIVVPESEPLTVQE